MKKHSIIFFGLGNIVTGYDNNLKNCHLSEILKTKKYKIIGGVDNNKSRQQLFTKYSGSKILDYKDLTNKRVDTVAICTPTPTHLDVFKNILDSGLIFSNLFCEKPFCSNIEEFNEIHNYCSKNNICVYTGFQRSHMPYFKNLREEFKKDRFGKFQGSVIFYSKGLKNNASHAVDLISFILDETLLEYKKINEYKEILSNDPNYSFFSSSHGREILFLPMDERNFSIFEIDIFFEKKRFRIINNSFDFEEYDVMEDKNYPGYSGLIKVKEGKTNMEESIKNLWEEIYCMSNNRNPMPKERLNTAHKIKTFF